MLSGTMAQRKGDVVIIIARLEKVVGDLRNIYQPAAGNISEEDLSGLTDLCTLLSTRVGDIESDLSKYTNRSSSVHWELECKKHSSASHDQLSRESSLEEHTAQPPKMLPDAKLRQKVSSFYQNDLVNSLEGVPQDIKKHVQEVTMAMHKQAYEQLWRLVEAQLKSREVCSILNKEFLPTIQLPLGYGSTDAFKEYFRTVHCGDDEPHPPSDVRSILSTREAVLKIRNYALEVQTPDYTVLHKHLSTGLEIVCRQRLEEYSMHFKMTLSRLASQICSVVSAMLLHSSPIIPFTRLEAFFSAYHEPTRSARQDPEGRRVLVYRTPYLYYYHYGELKTLRKASVTFEEPPKNASIGNAQNNGPKDNNPRLPNKRYSGELLQATSQVVNKSLDEKRIKMPPRNWKELQCQKTLECGRWCSSIAVQGDVVCVGVNGRVLLLSKTSGAQVCELGSDQIEGTPVLGVAFIDEDTIVVSADNRLRTYTTKGQLVSTFDSGKDWFVPRGLTVGPDGRIFVCDVGNHCVCVFNVYGKLLSSFGSWGSLVGHFYHPRDVCMDGEGLLFISDKLNSRICVHSVEGAFIREFPTPRLPYYVAATHCNHLIVSSWSSHTVMIMTTSGQLVHEFSEQGSGPGQFRWPTGVAVDNEDCVYVCDRDNKRVQVY